jgi:hypothetical protein
VRSEQSRGGFEDGGLAAGDQALFMSGYSESAMAGSEDLPGEAALLEKPFTAEALARKVRQVLSQ